MKDKKREEAEALDERLNEEFGPGKFAAMGMFARLLESSDTAQEKKQEKGGINVRLWLRRKLSYLLYKRERRRECR